MELLFLGLSGAVAAVIGGSIIRGWWDGDLPWWAATLTVITWVLLFSIFAA